MSDDERGLAELQLAMLRALSEGASADDVARRLRAANLTEAHRAWIDSFDPRAVEVAMAIAKRWVRVEGEGSRLGDLPGRTPP